MDVSKIKSAILCVTLLAAMGNVFASVELGASRVIFHEERNEALLKLKNPDKSSPFLVQSWLESYKFPDGRLANAMPKIPFVITPPLFRIEGGDENVLRIIKNGQRLPDDRESVFTLNVKAIPETEKNQMNTMVFAIKSSIKLIYRPKSLEGKKAESAYEQVTFRRDKNQLIASNPTPYFITLSNVNINGQKVDIKNNTMLEPMGTAMYPLPQVRGNTLSWQSIGDLGQLTAPQTTTVH